MNPVSNINIKPVVYLKDTNDDYILDNDNKKIIEKVGIQVAPFDDYEYLVTITEFMR